MGDCDCERAILPPLSSLPSFMARAEVIVNDVQFDCDDDADTAVGSVYSEMELCWLPQLVVSLVS